MLSPSKGAVHRGRSRGSALDKAAASEAVAAEANGPAPEAPSIYVSLGTEREASSKPDAAKGDSASSPPGLDPPTTPHEVTRKKLEREF